MIARPRPASGPRPGSGAGLVVGAVAGAVAWLLVALLVVAVTRHSTADLEDAARVMVPDPAAASFGRVESVPLPAFGESGSVTVTIPGAARQDELLAEVRASATAARPQGTEGRAHVWLATGHDFPDGLSAGASWATPVGPRCSSTARPRLRPGPPPSG